MRHKVTSKLTSPRAQKQRERSREKRRQALQVACDDCGAQPGHACRLPNGESASRPHLARRANATLAAKEAR